MKKFYYFVLASILCRATNAQTVPAGENISLDQQLSNINQTTVTSGIIYERVIQIAIFVILIERLLLKLHSNF